MGGIALPIIFWAINREKSKFVSFHALQALFFHISYIVILVFVIIFMIFGGTGIGIVTARHTQSASPALFMLFMFALYGFMFLYIFGCMGYAIYIGIKAYNGQFKKYPIIGNIVYKNIYGDTYNVR